MERSSGGGVFALETEGVAAGDVNLEAAGV